MGVGGGSGGFGGGLAASGGGVPPHQLAGWLFGGGEEEEEVGFAEEEEEDEDAESLVGRLARLAVAGDDPGPTFEQLWATYYPGLDADEIREDILRRVLERFGG